MDIYSTTEEIFRMMRFWFVSGAWSKNILSFRLLIVAVLTMAAAVAAVVAKLFLSSQFILG